MNSFENNSLKCGILRITEVDLEFLYEKNELHSLDDYCFGYNCVDWVFYDDFKQQFHQNNDGLNWTGSISKNNNYSNCCIDGTTS